MSLLSRIGNLLHGDRHAQELADELACHVDLRTEENIERGMPDTAVLVIGALTRPKPMPNSR